MCVCSYLVNSGVGSATVSETVFIAFFFLIVFNWFAPEEFSEFPMEISEKSVIAVKLK